MNNLLHVAFAVAVFTSLGIIGAVREPLASDTTEMVRESTKAGGEFIDDAVITARVKAALVRDPLTSALSIGVETLEGTVQLSRFVDSADEKEKAEEIAKSVEGVIAVENALSVKPPDNQVME